MLFLMKADVVHVTAKKYVSDPMIQGFTALPENMEGYGFEWICAMPPWTKLIGGDWSQSWYNRLCPGEAIYFYMKVFW
jgi:hypothetical protein